MKQNKYKNIVTKSQAGEVKAINDVYYILHLHNNSRSTKWSNKPKVQFIPPLQWTVDES